MAVLPFAVCNNLQALPHPTSVGAGVVRLNLIPVLMLYLFDVLSEGITGFIISVRVRVPLLESGSLDVACNPWLLVGLCTYGHCGDDVVDALINEACG